MYENNLFFESNILIVYLVEYQLLIFKKSILYKQATVTRKFPVNSNGLHGEVDGELSPFGLLLLTQPLHPSEQHTRANLEFSSNFGQNIASL